MGMFDYIECKMPLPPAPIKVDGDVFQTKDTPDQYMTTYTITSDGRLIWRPYEMQEVPKSERPYPDAPDNDIRSIFGCIRRVESEPEEVAYHGDIRFYNLDEAGNWIEYRARFTEGVCVRIDLIDCHGPRA